MQFRRDGAAVMRARHEGCKSKIMLSIFRLVATCKCILSPREQVSGDQRRMMALVLDPLPNEVAEIKAAFQDRFEICAGQLSTEFIQHRLTQSDQRVDTTCIQFEDSLHHWTTFGVEINRPCE